MDQTALRIWHARFQEYRSKCKQALCETGVEQFVGGYHHSTGFDDFCRFWTRMESNPSLLREWMARLAPGGFEQETALLSEELALLPRIPLDSQGAKGRGASMPTTLRKRAG